MSTATENVIKVGSDAAFQQAIEQPGVTAVDFWATWCQPCVAYGPILESYASSAPEDVTVLKVNVDDHADIARRYGIRSIPTTIFFKQGEEVGRLGGVVGAKQLAAAVDSYR